MVFFLYIAITYYSFNYNMIMTNIFIQTPVYISIEEVKDSTSNNDIKTLSNEQIQTLIVKA